ARRTAREGDRAGEEVHLARRGGKDFETLSTGLWLAIGNKWRLSPASFVVVAYRSAGKNINTRSSILDLRSNISNLRSPTLNLGDRAYGSVPVEIELLNPRPALFFNRAREDQFREPGRYVTRIEGPRRADLRDISLSFRQIQLAPNAVNQSFAFAQALQIARGV